MSSSSLLTVVPTDIQPPHSPTPSPVTRPNSRTSSRSPTPTSPSPPPPIIDALQPSHPPPSLLSIPFEHSRVLSVSERIHRSPRNPRHSPHPSPPPPHSPLPATEWRDDDETLPPLPPSPPSPPVLPDRHTLRASMRDSDLRRRRSPLVQDEAGEEGGKEERGPVVRERVTTTALVKEEEKGGLMMAAMSVVTETITAAVKLERRTDTAAAPRSSPTASASAPTSPTSSSVPLPSPRRSSLTRLLSSSTLSLLSTLTRRGSSLFSRRPPPPVDEAEGNREWLHRRMARQDDTDAALPPTTLLPLSSASLSNPLLPVHRRVFTFCRVRLFPPLLVLLVLVQLIVLPVRLALSVQLDNAWWLNDQWLDLLYVIGVLVTDYVEVSLPTGVEEEGGTSAGVTVRLRSGAMTRQLVLDVLSTLPYGLLIPSSSLLFLFADPVHATPIRLAALLHLPRLLRLPRLSFFIEHVELANLMSSTIDPTYFRLLTFSIQLFLLAHLVGCAWLTVSYMEGLPEDSEWVVSDKIRNTSTLPSLYIHSLYVGFSSMTGAAPTPTTTVEHVLTLVVLFIGVSVYGLLIGNLTALISNLNSKADDFRDKMAAVTELMVENDLPVEVQLRVRSCMQYLFGYQRKEEGGKEVGRQKGREGWEVLNVLPAYLRNELLCYMNGDIIRTVPLFRDCSDGFMRSLVPLLTPEVVIPGDLLIREGEIGREMYLLRQGQLEVIAHGRVVATLTSGGFVGEVCLLWEDTKRTASVRAATFCDVLVLSKEDFDSVVSQYPEVQKRMKMEARMRKNARELQDKQVQDKQVQDNQQDSNNTSSSTTASGGGAGSEGGGKGEVGDRMRTLVRQGSLHAAAMLRQDSGGGSTASTPTSTRPSTPSSSSSSSTTNTPLYPLMSPAAAGKGSTSGSQHQRGASLAAMLDVLQTVRAKEGEGGEAGRRHTLPTANGDGELQTPELESRGKLKWKKLRLLTKGR